VHTTCLLRKHTGQLIVKPAANLACESDLYAKMRALLT